MSARTRRLSSLKQRYRSLLVIVALGLLGRQAAARQSTRPLPAGSISKEQRYIEVPKTASNTAESSSVKPQASARTPWWELFNDPHLTKVIKQALLGNYDLSAAVARIQQAEAVALGSLSPLLPRLSVDGSGNLGPANSVGFQFGVGGERQDQPSLFINGSVLLNGNMEVDITGRRYLAYRANRLSERASAGDRDSVALALVAQVATAYFDAVSAAEQLGVLKKQLQSNQRLYELTRARFERGESTGLAVLQQRQQVEAIRAQLPPARIQLRIALQQLQILPGRPPAQGIYKIAQQLPSSVPPTHKGRPIDLIAHRPDLRASSLRVESAEATAKSAWRTYLPSLNINGNTGWQYFILGEANTQFVWGLGGALSIPLFAGFANKSTANEAAAAKSAATRTFQQLAVNAVGEVEAASVRQQEFQLQLEAIRRQLEAAKNAFKSARERYLTGLSTYTDVLLAIATKQTVELNLVTAKQAMIGANIQLRTALGGPWTKNLMQKRGSR